MSSFTLFFLSDAEMPGSLGFGLEVAPHLLYDHRPLQLNRDDYSRVCQIPKKKVYFSSLVFFFFMFCFSWSKDLLSCIYAFQELLVM